MSELLPCPSCGKETNKFAPGCEHCGASLPKSAASDGTKRDGITDSAVAPHTPDTIEDHGHALHKTMERYAGARTKCPLCAEEIQAEAIKCRYCGATIRSRSAGTGKVSAFVGGFITALVGVALVAGITIGAPRLLHRPLPASVSDKRITEPSDALKSDPVKADYIKRFVTLSGMGTLDDTDPKTAVPTKYIYGTVSNTGAKLIIKLQITVYYFDAKGACIAEGTVCPILGTKTKPASLKPNASKEFQLPLTPIPPGWSGKIKSKVSDIEFAD